MLILAFWGPKFRKKWGSRREVLIQLYIENSSNETKNCFPKYLRSCIVCRRDVDTWQSHSPGQGLFLYVWTLNSSYPTPTLVNRVFSVRKIHSYDCHYVKIKTSMNHSIFSLFLRSKLWRSCKIFIDETKKKQNKKFSLPPSHA